MWTACGEDQTVFSRDPYIKIIKRDYSIPNISNPEDFYLLGYCDWVNIVALTRNFEIVLVNQFRPGINRMALGLPSGTVDDTDVSPLLCAQRELKEETGFIGDRFTHLYTQSPNTANHLNKVSAFLALDITQSHVPIDENEIAEVISMDLCELLKKLLSNTLDHEFQILHSASIFYAVNWIMLSTDENLSSYRQYLLNNFYNR